MRSLSTLTFLFPIASTNPAKAGVFISNGVLPSWTLATAASSTNAGTALYFPKGVWADVDADLNLED